MGDTSRKKFSRLSRPFTKGIPDNVKAESKAPFLKNSTFGPAKKTFYILCCEGLRKDAGERNGQDLRGGGLNHIGKGLCRNAQAFLHKQGGDALFCFDAMQRFGLIIGSIWNGLQIEVRPVPTADTCG